MDHRRLAHGEVVAVEGDVEVAGGRLGLEQVGDEPVQARGEVGAAAVDADQREVARRGSSRRSRARCAPACAGRRPRRGRPWADSVSSFLASRDRVKGRLRRQVAAGPTTPRRRGRAQPRRCSPALVEVARAAAPGPRARGPRGPLVVLGHALERPARLELDGEQAQLARERGVGALDPRAAARRRRARRGPRRARRRPRSTAGRAARRRRQEPHRVADRRGRRTPWRSSARRAASSSSAARARERRRRRRASSRATARRGCGSITTSPSAASARSAARRSGGPRRRRRELELGQRLAGRELAVEVRVEPQRRRGDGAR